MAALFPENLGLDIASVNSNGGNVDASSTSCMSSFGSGFSAMKVQEKLPCWSNYVALTECLSDDVDLQTNLCSEPRRQRLSRESPSTETDSARWTAWDSPSLVSKEKRLYKTELCRSWEESGKCRYGGKCQYAHGKEELRPVARHPKFKTEVCCTFVTLGTCPYGRRCRFIHRNVPITAVGKQTSSHTGQGVTLISHVNSITASSRRLPVFIKLARGLEC